MSLSSELISQFAKITKDNKETKKEMTVYGTTVDDDGTMYVKLDGSELLTPVLATADTKPGERVIVMIKNHTATITGNLSSPAARSGDLKDVNDLPGRMTELEAIVAKKVDQSDFDTEVKRIDTLTGNTETATKNITDIQNDIDNLQIAMLKKVETSDFETEQGRIDTLNSSVNTINKSLTTVQNDIKKLSTDYITENGSTNIWSYRKWASGNVELWGVYSITEMSCTTAFGGMYRTGIVDTPTFPYQLTDVSLVANYESDEQGMLLWAVSSTTATKPPNYYLICPASTTITSGTIVFHVFGKLVD